MKLSENTISILKNFSLINPSISVKPGNVIRTISPQRSIFASATVEEVFPESFAIYELNKFTSVLSLFEEPDLEFYDKYLKIIKGKYNTRYVYADESTIILPPEKEIKLPSVDIEFDLSAADLNKITRALSVLHMPEISIVGDDGTIYVKAIDNKNANADSFSIAVGVTDKVFNMIIKSENLKIMPKDYKLQISSKGIVKFTSADLNYWIATDARSKFGV